MKSLWEDFGEDFGRILNEHFDKFFGMNLGLDWLVKDFKMTLNDFFNIALTYEVPWEDFGKTLWWLCDDFGKTVMTLWWHFGVTLM